MNQFEVGKNEIVWVGSDFKEWFSGVKASPKKVKLVHKTLEKSMSDSEILEQWKPEPVTLGDVLWTMKNSKDVLTTGHANIFYVKDKDDILRAVGVYWSADDGGWDVDAYSVTCPSGWGGGRRVFSRNSFDFVNPSKPLELEDLETRVKSLESDMEKIRKFLVF